MIQQKKCPRCREYFFTGGRGRPMHKQKFCSRFCAVTNRYNLETVIINTAVPAIAHPSKLDIAWAAGFYEGEGHVIKENSQIVGITQKKPWALERLRDLFGGRVTNQIAFKSGKNIGMDRARMWIVNGPRARGFLMTIYRFLSPRRQKRIREVLAA